MNISHAVLFSFSNVCILSFIHYQNQAVELCEVSNAITNK